MNLEFRKSEDGTVDVRIIMEGEESDFTYLAMIRSLIADGPMKDAEISERFTDGEVKSIQRMVSMINEAAVTSAQDEEEDSSDEDDDEPF